jgi:hypothetical protein
VDGNPVYFSYDGINLLTQFHNPVAANNYDKTGAWIGGDLADWENTRGDAFGPTPILSAGDAFGPILGTAKVTEPGSLSMVDIAEMEALGWHAKTQFHFPNPQFAGLPAARDQQLETVPIHLGGETQPLGHNGGTDPLGIVHTGGPVPFSNLTHLDGETLPISNVVHTGGPVPFSTIEHSGLSQSFWAKAAGSSGLGASAGPPMHPIMDLANSAHISVGLASHIPEINLPATQLAANHVDAVQHVEVAQLVHPVDPGPVYSSIDVAHHVADFAHQIHI